VSEGIFGSSSFRCFVLRCSWSARFVEWVAEGGHGRLPAPAGGWFVVKGALVLQILESKGERA
jgi:hypothetical protein